MGSRVIQAACILAFVAMLPVLASAQTSSTQPGAQDPQTPSTPPATTFTVTVIGATPLVGIELPIELVAAPVQRR
jgi:hypothetical protein